VRRLRWHNFNLLKGQTREGMAALILDSLPIDAKLARIHVSGDFFSDTYFLAWMDVAKARPETLFYGYTKSLVIWLRHQSSVPANFKLTASEGGKYDDLIESESLKSAKVLFRLARHRSSWRGSDHAQISTQAQFRVWEAENPFEYWSRHSWARTLQV
jgi:hypothetical protein